MKRFKLFSILTLICSLISGCSCSKVDETTYQDAVSVYKSSDALSFSRIEVISTSNATSYTRKKIDAKYVFDANRQVNSMEYSLVVSQNNNGGNSNILVTTKYYYSNERKTLYSYSKIGESQLERYKHTDTTYNANFNINVCNDIDCMLMIIGNFAPIYELNEISEFRIEEEGNKGIAYFKAVCPNYESCSSSSEVIEYKVVIDVNGNIEAISYDILNGDTTHNIKYTFYGYGSNNVSVEFPADLESYIEK